MCCGRYDKQASNTASEPALAPRPQTPPDKIAGIPIRYEGRTGMTVIGPVSGRVYRFSSPGSRVELDARDASTVAAIPKLRFVR